MFLCEVCAIFKNTFFVKHVRATASENIQKIMCLTKLCRTNFNLTLMAILYCRKRQCIDLDSDAHAKIQEQPSRGVVRKRYSENVQQIYWGTSISKHEFNKVAKQLN